MNTEPPAHPSVYTVMVTYGNRAELVKRVVPCALANGVGRIIVVDNGSVPAAEQALGQLGEQSNGRIVIVRLSENRGSAGGFKAGIERALDAIDCEYVWLLDDDNCPSEGALGLLLASLEQLRRSVLAERLAVQSVRENWLEHRLIARGVPVAKAYPRKSSFLGFHFFTPPRVLAKFREAQGALEDVRIPAAVQIPFGPYGGFCAHKNVLRELGYPDERFYLYADDTEYTSRLVRGGGYLFLVPKSVVRDLDASWHVLNDGETLFSHLLLADSDRRIYFATRNQSYLETHIFKRNAAVHRLNQWAFFFCLAGVALRYRKWQRFYLIARAVREGRNGHLNDPDDHHEP